MSPLSVINTDELDETAGIPAPFCEFQGSAKSYFVHPDDVSIWCAVSDVDAGSELVWGETHGDEIVYVLSGGIVFNGQSCGSGAAVLIESGAPATVGIVQPSRIVHFGPVSAAPPIDGPLGPAKSDGHGVHILRESEIRHLDVGGGGRGRFYADSDCPTCRLTLFRNSVPAGTRSSSHSHSQDEIILLLAGDMQFGRNLVAPGGAVVVPADHRYGFQTKEGCEFLNYRADAALMTMNPADPPMLETYRAVKAELQSRGDDLTSTWTAPLE